MVPALQGRHTASGNRGPGSGRHEVTHFGGGQVGGGGAQQGPAGAGGGGGHLRAAGGKRQRETAAKRPAVAAKRAKSSSKRACTPRQLANLVRKVVVVIEVLTAPAAGVRNEGLGPGAAARQDQEQEAVPEVVETEPEADVAVDRASTIIAPRERGLLEADPG